MTGSTLSHYEITSELGRGGMGIVYLAEDTKLDRQVAIKVLPSAALASADDRERFYREAKSAAALNHPNIAQIYQIDEAVPSDAPHGTQPSPFIAMEYIDGETLDSRIKKGPLKLKEAVRLATQIAGALGAAHDKGIVHRDVKSSNVMLTSKGDAKVLDFGLALTAASTKLTRMGSTLGTVAYMSPEQARGEEVDNRTDLWALGVVLYEMVAGRNPFGGDYEQAVVYSILNTDPEPLTAVRTGVPMELERIVNKALAKDADLRYQTAADLVADLKAIDISGSGVSRRSVSAYSTRSGSVRSSASISTFTPAGSFSTQPWVWPLGALVAGILLTAGAFAAFRSEPPPPKMTRVNIQLPGLSFVRFPTMSPTGDYLALQALSSEGLKGIFLRDMQTGELQFIRESMNGGDREMGFSPDGSQLAYNASDNDGLFVVDIPSGIPVQLTEFGRFAYWESSDVIVMTDDRAGGSQVFRVPLSDPEPILIPEEKNDLPEGYNGVLKTHIPGTKWAFGHQLVRAGGGTQDLSFPANIYALNTASGETEILAQNAINPYFAPPDYLIYQIGDDNGQLVARRLSADRTEFAGPPLNALPFGQTYWGDFNVTPQGDLMYLDDGRNLSLLRNEMWEVNLKEGVVRPLPGLMPGDQASILPRVSPDGRLMAFMYPNESNNWNIHLYDREREVGQQLTFLYDNFFPSFSPDSRFLYWSQAKDDSSFSIMRMPVDQSVPAQLIQANGGFSRFSSDERWMAFTRPSGKNANLMLLDLQSGREQVLDSVSATPMAQSFSPDSRYLAYVTDQSGSAQIRIKSVDGVEDYELPGVRGRSAAFTDDGSALIIESSRALYLLPIRTNPSFGVRGTQEILMNIPYSNGFDLLGENRYVVSSAAVQLSGGEAESSNLVWLQNWSSYLQEELNQ